MWQGMKRDIRVCTLWAEYNTLLGVEVHTTTAYHPRLNGRVWRFHLQLKAAFKAHATTTSDWFTEHPLVLLGTRSSWRVDPGCSPAELLYGPALRLTGECLQLLDARTMDPNSMSVNFLQETIRSMESSLLTVLQSWPPLGLSMSDTMPSATLPTTLWWPIPHYWHWWQFYTVDTKGRVEKVSVDHLKAACVTPPTATARKIALCPGTDAAPTSPKPTSSAGESAGLSIQRPWSPVRNQLLVATRSGRYQDFDDSNFSFVAFKIVKHFST